MAGIASHGKVHLQGKIDEIATWQALRILLAASTNHPKHDCQVQGLFHRRVRLHVRLDASAEALEVEDDSVVLFFRKEER